MVYRNIKTGAEIITSSVIKAPDWEPWPKVSPKIEAPVIKEPQIDEEKPVTQAQTAPKKAIKKRTKK